MIKNEKGDDQHSPYRQSDQYYIDMVDRETIEELKAKEKEEKDELAGIEDPEKIVEITLRRSVSYDSFRNLGIFYARQRRHLIEKMMRNDEHMDRLIERTPEPKGIRCKTCNGSMSVCNHFFDVKEIPIMFVFDCPDGHAPRRVIYPDGREYFFPKPKCPKCRFEITKKTKKLKTKIVTVCNCAMCGKSWKEELDIRMEKKTEAPIAPEDRAKYCLGFEGLKTFLEDLESLTNVLIKADADAAVRNKMETSGANKIEKLTIPELEFRLGKASEIGGFIKFLLEKPEMKQHVRVPFTAQDPLKRNERESLKEFKEIIGKELLPTNWRLVGDVTYRLGYLSGGLKAFEQDEDLIRLAEEIGKGSRGKGFGKE